ncbi:bifunctional protein-serine/threonine kinase/phosphatase [Thauera propionica]|uniref:bifunctional protein-serine/threonine kinase/phosphatase n=1 Tax=Thauera propionica TaxID=2019431 RepID=UPI00197D4376|nr:bifunctional protein-serine/threonine kinase/phosphatase [Thauera propionica]
MSVGQHSLAGEHGTNQDFHGAVLPTGAQLAAKGVVLAIADGIGSSEVSHLASQTAVGAFLEDYYATSEAWTVRRAAQRVLGATNAWLHGQTMRSDGRFDKDRGYVCTFSALVLKGRQIHLLHVGDSRIYRLHAHSLEQLTKDHRIHHAADESYLARALGIGPHVEIDYLSWEAEVGEVYLLATDGACAQLDAVSVHQAIAEYEDDLDAAAARLVEHARAVGSDDATLQLLRIDTLPEGDGLESRRRREGLVLPQLLAPRMEFEGFAIVRELQVSARSHVWLATDLESGRPVVLKTPSIDLRDDDAYLDSFVLEEWVARRVDNPHVIKAWPGSRRREALYVAMEYIEGQTLAQWMVDHPSPPLDLVRPIIEQLALGLQALHSRDMLHRDLRPENVMIDHAGTVKLIDLASVCVGGLTEGLEMTDAGAPPGTLQYMAPECLLGETASPSADLFALATISYQMLSGQLPYGLESARVRTPRDLRRLRYVPLRHLRPELPAWVDGVIGKALHVMPGKRQEAVSEFIHDLRAPSASFQRVQRRLPLVERDPVLFWKVLSVLLALTVVALVFHISVAP